MSNIARMSYPDSIKADGQDNSEFIDIQPSEMVPVDTTPMIPGYKVEKLISSGAMGHVYLATQEALERPVAIKVITHALSIDAAFRQRFLKEGKIIAQLRHPHIVTIHDIGECLNQYYMIMEYVEGGTLRDRIEQGLSPQQAVNILRQIASALGYAHHQGFVHRDVKPANILFRNDNSAVLTDFGIAKACEDNVDLTGTGLAIGTVVYMSPEQTWGKILDGRSDLYSLGLVFYEMLTGFRPGRTVGGLVDRLPMELNRYQETLDKLLAFNPNERFATAERLIDAIDKIGQEQNNNIIVLPSVNGAKKSNRWFNKYFIIIVLLLIAFSLAGISYHAWERSLNPVLSIQVVYSHRSTDQLNLRPLLNDSVLHSGDHYQIRFMPEQDGYVYIFQIDGSGAIYRLFPFEGGDNSKPGNGNPVRAGITYFVPAEDEAFQLDDQVGREQIHVLAFKNRNTDLENQYTTLVEARRIHDYSRTTELQLQLSNSLINTQNGAISVLNFKHNARGSHEL